MTNNQMETYRNHNGSSTKYDMISLFSLHPPELCGVFTNPIDYFGLYHIDENPMNEDDNNNLLDYNMLSCAWIDCLGRHITNRKLVNNEITDIIQNNIEILRNNYYLTKKEDFVKSMNDVVNDIIN